MSRPRITAALTVAIVALGSLLATPAANAATTAAAAPMAAPVAATPPIDPSKGNIEVGIQYQAQWLSPNDQVEVSLWKLDTETDYYVQQPAVAWSGGSGSWISDDLEPGVYSIRFLANDVSIGLQWFDGARYFFESESVTVTAAHTSALGWVELEERSFDVFRAAGASRFETAAEISQWIVPDGSTPDVVYVTNGMTYPDALAAGPAAILHGGVLLLSQANALPTATRNELSRLQPKRVVIVGGQGAVSATVKTAIEDLLPGAIVDRIGGASRYETGENIVRDAFTSGATTALISTGRNYPDALAAGPAAGALGAPVILVDGAAGAASAATLQLLDDLGVDEVVIIGGAGAVSTGIESSLIAHGIGDVFRVAGSSRFATAAQLNAAVFGPTDDSLLANGMNFPDALAGAPLAGAWGAPLFLTPATCVGLDAAVGITAQRSNGVTLLGGEGALSPAVANLQLCG